MHGYYGLDPKTIDNCCEIKSSWKHRGAGSGTKDKKVCGQFEGSCNNQDECMPGHGFRSGKSHSLEDGTRKCEAHRGVPIVATGECTGGHYRIDEGNM